MKFKNRPKLELTDEEEETLCSAVGILDTIRAEMRTNKIEMLEQDVDLRDLDKTIDTIDVVVEIGCYR